MFERGSGLEHHCHVDLLVGKGAPLCGSALGLEIGGRTQSAVTPQADGGITRCRNDVPRMIGGFHLRAMKIPHASVEQPCDPFPIGLRRSHRNREVDGARQQRHVRKRLHR